MNIFERLKRDPCKECIYFCKKTNICESKKCASNNPYITKLDKMFCEPLKKEVNNKYER